MLLDYFLKGIVLAFYIVVPIGAISVLYIKRTLQNGVASGIASSLGVSTAEAFYASVAIYGLTFVSDFLLQWRIWLQLCGTVFLVIIGMRTFFAHPLKITIRKKQKLFSDYFSMFILTAVNPLTLIGFVTIFTTFGANNLEKDFYHSFIMLCGFVFMSFSYCLLLVFITNLLRERFVADDSDLFKILNQISGLVIIVFTILAFAMALVKN